MLCHIYMMMCDHCCYPFHKSQLHHLAEMLVGAPPFRGTNQRDLLNNILTKPLILPDDIPVSNYSINILQQVGLIMFVCNHMSNHPCQSIIQWMNEWMETIFFESDFKISYDFKFFLIKYLYLSFYLLVIKNSSSRSIHTS